MISSLGLFYVHLEIQTHIQKAILRHPQSSRLWTFLAQYILRYAKGNDSMILKDPPFMHLADSRSMLTQQINADSALLRSQQRFFSSMSISISHFIVRRSGEGAMASVAARSAQAVDPKNEEGVLLESLGMLVSSSPLEGATKKRRSNVSKSAITAAAKAVHLHPDRLEAWSSLTGVIFTL